MITSKLTSKAQTTIPQPVRTALGLREGDEIAYRIEESGIVVLSRVTSADKGDDPFHAFTEWDSEADRRAYADL
jgi:antitoxin PrlF